MDNTSSQLDEIDRPQENDDPRSPAKQPWEEPRIILERPLFATGEDPYNNPYLRPLSASADGTCI